MKYAGLFPRQIFFLHEERKLFYVGSLSLSAMVYSLCLLMVRILFFLDVMAFESAKLYARDGFIDSFGGVFWDSFFSVSTFVSTIVLLIKNRKLVMSCDAILFLNKIFRITKADLKMKLLDKMKMAFTIGLWLGSFLFVTFRLGLVFSHFILNFSHFITLFVMVYFFISLTNNLAFLQAKIHDLASADMDIIFKMDISSPHHPVNRIIIGKPITKSSFTVQNEVMNRLTGKIVQKKERTNEKNYCSKFNGIRNSSTFF